jgi:hypothetical protein
MTRYAQLGTRQELYAVAANVTGVTAGTITKSSWSSANGWSIPLAVGTYKFPFGGERYGNMIETVMHSLSLLWSEGLAGTFTLEGTNFAKSQSGADQGGADTSDYDLTSAWQLFNPTQAGLLYAVANGTNNSMSTALTATLGGTNAGGAFYNLPDIGAGRMRGSLVVTAPGNLRIALNAKLGS